jgi:hypothetical protein
LVYCHLLLIFVHFPARPEVEIVTVKARQWRLSAPGQARVIASPDGQTQLVIRRRFVRVELGNLCEKKQKYRDLT